MKNAHPVGRTILWGEVGALPGGLRVGDLPPNGCSRLCSMWWQSSLQMGV
jgi:hypothetical protein